MNTAPIVPARPVFDTDGTPRSPVYDDIYHPRAGALVQARDVFLAGNELPQRWHGQDRFVILETGFGLGNNFLATWAAHRSDAGRCRQLHFISVEAHPLAAADLSALPRDAGFGELAAQLAEAWPPLTCNLHRLAFDDGAVQLLLAFGDVAAWLPQIEARVDAFYLDGFAPARNPAMWEARVLRAVGRLAAPRATLATWTAARSVRDGLRSAGFEVRAAPGSGGKRDITLARFAPVVMPRLAARRQGRRSPGVERIVIVGAGLAGCATAWALAEQGRTSTVIERNDGIAMEGSGNAAGIFHGVVHAADGRHARFNRAAAIEAERVIRTAIERQGVAGRCDGLLRLAQGGAGDKSGLDALAARLGLPAGYVQALSPAQASTLAGSRIDGPAWFYPGGGWVDPRGLARAYLERAQPAATLRLGVAAASLRRTGTSWELLDARGEVLETAEVVVLANAGGAFELLRSGDWPVGRVRGQISALAADAFAISSLPALPLAGSGYLVPASGGKIWFGATAQPGDDDPSVRARDHQENLARLIGLVGPSLSPDASCLDGRTGFRWVSDDRLPLIGAMPAAVVAGLSIDEAAKRPGRFDQSRFIERSEGLFVFTALGSRGIAWSALGAQVLASAITGAPCPLEADLIDAVDPARFISRAWRRGSARRTPAGADQLPLGPTAGGSAGDV